MKQSIRIYYFLKVKLPNNNTLRLFSNILKTVDSNLTDEMLCVTKTLENVAIYLL